MELASDIVQDIVRFFKISELEVRNVLYWLFHDGVCMYGMYVCVVIVGGRLSGGAGAVRGSVEDRCGLQCEQTAVT